MDSGDAAQSNEGRARVTKLLVDDLKRRGFRIEDQSELHEEENDGWRSGRATFSNTSGRRGGNRRGQSRGRGRKVTSQNEEDAGLDYPVGHRSRGHGVRGGRTQGRAKYSSRGRGRGNLQGKSSGSRSRDSTSYVGLSVHSDESDPEDPVRDTGQVLSQVYTSRTSTAKSSSKNDQPQSSPLGVEDIHLSCSQNATINEMDTSKTISETADRTKEILGADTEKEEPPQASQLCSDHKNTKRVKSKPQPTQIRAVLKYESVMNGEELCSELDAVTKFIGRDPNYIIQTITKNMDTFEITLNVPSKAGATKLCKTVSAKPGTIMAEVTAESKISRGKGKAFQVETDELKGVFLRSLKEKMAQECKMHQIKIEEVSQRLSSMNTKNKSVEMCKPLEGKKNELLAQQEEFQMAVQKLENRVKQSEIGQLKKEMELCGKIFSKECKKLATALPMYAQRSQILKTVENSQVCIILGETGSGKSTQVPLYLVEAGIGKQRPIVCTEPRKVAAMSLSKHVAEEMGCALGTSVGYRIGRDAKANNLTELLYMTDHSLLNECLKDPDLSQYSCVIVDEAHERSIYTDLLLGMIKKCLLRRPDLKVIITSATIDPDIFVKYFGNCPVLRVPGRLFPVDVQYRRHPRGPEHDYLGEAIEKVKHVYRTEGPGDILVFLATPAETERAFNTLDGYNERLLCLQLHGKLQSQDQQKVFIETPRGLRKVIFSTNVAETSVTIPGVKFVIDTGMCKEKTFDAKRNMGVLEINNISKSSAEQRKGRAGRTAPGKCFRLYTLEEYESFESSSAPEILRVHLGQALLKLMELGVENPLSFDFVEAPPETAMTGAMTALHEIDAVSKDTGKLTALGKELSKVALEPRLGKFVLEGIRENVSLEAIVIAAYASSGSNAYYRGGSREEKAKADAQKTTFCHEDGDFFTFLAVYREWEKLPSERERTAWCFANSINAKTMKNVRQQVHDIRFDMKRDLGIAVGMQFKESGPELHKSLAKLLLGCYPSQLCHFSGHRNAGYILSTGEACYHVHPSSALCLLGQEPKWVLYNQLLKTSQDFMLNLTVVSDDVVEKMNADGRLSINEKALECKMVSAHEVKNVGTHLLRALAGYRHAVRRSLEDQISEALGVRPIIIDLDFDNVTANTYAPTGCHVKAESKIQAFLMKERSILQKEKIQEPVGHKNPICVLQGQGGSVEQVLMPGEFRVFHFTLPAHMFSEATKGSFESYGDVEIIKFHKCKVPGRVQCKLIYSSCENAECAYQYASTLAECKAWPEKTGDRARASSAFKLKLTWVRRPNKGIAYIKLQNDEDSGRVFDMLTGVPFTGSRFRNPQYITFHNDRVLLKFLGKGSGDLMLKDLDARLSNRVIQAEVKELFQNEGIGHEEPRVVVPREPSFLTTSVDIDYYKQNLRELVENIGKTSEFEISMPEPKNKSNIEQYAWVEFKDPNAGARVLENLQYTEANLQYLSKRLLGTVVISGEVMAVIHESLVRYQNELSPDEQDMELKQKEQGHWFVNISAKSVKLYANLKGKIDKLVSPYTIDCFDDNSVEAQLLQSGKNAFLDRVARQTRTSIRVDTRYKRINITGTVEDKERAKIIIKEHLQTLKPLIMDKIKLAGQGCPRALMRTFLKRYGLDLDELTERCGLQSARLDLLKHTLVAVGDTDATTILHATIDDMKREVQHGEVDKGNKKDTRPDCSVCLCPAEKTYRLNCCGHPYCTRCLTCLVTNAIKHSEFPLVCARDECSASLLLKDIREVVGENYENMTKAAVSCYVKKNQELIRYCLTPDCHTVYRVTQEAASFTCPICYIQICTACGFQNHDGLSCKENKHNQMSEEEHLELWLNEDKRNRALCPGCKAKIEKNGGCRKMHCIQCDAIFCWICKQVFRSEDACYDHLTAAHGGIFGDDLIVEEPAVRPRILQPAPPRARVREVERIQPAALRGIYGDIFGDNLIVEEQPVRQRIRQPAPPPPRVREVERIQPAARDREYFRARPDPVPAARPARVAPMGARIGEDRPAQMNRGLHAARVPAEPQPVPRAVPLRVARPAPEPLPRPEPRPEPRPQPRAVYGEPPKKKECIIL